MGIRGTGYTLGYDAARHWRAAFLFCYAAQSRAALFSGKAENMLQDIPNMPRDEIYRGRFEIAGLIAQSRGLMTTFERDKETREQGNMLRREIDAAESALLSVTRPR